MKSTKYNEKLKREKLRLSKQRKEQRKSREFIKYLSFLSKDIMKSTYFNEDYREGI